MNTMSFPLVTSGRKHSLQAQLVGMGIPILEDAFVRETKSRTVDNLRTFGPLSVCCMIATNGYLASVALAILTVLTIAVIAWAGPTPLIVPPVLLATLLAMTFIYQKYAEHGAATRNIIRNKGAHWRRTRMVELTDHESGYGFRGNLTAGPTAIPYAAKQIVDAARNVEDARIDVEYIADDPFIVVSRKRLFSTERVYVFHWV